MKTNANNLSLTSIEDTQKAIQIVKKRIELKEQILEERLQQLPQEIIKAGIGKVIPAFINAKISNRTWSIFKDALGLLSPFSTNKVSLMKDVVKQVGLIGLLKLVIAFFTNKQETTQ